MELERINPNKPARYASTVFGDPQPSVLGTVRFRVNAAHPGRGSNGPAV
jgi:hypothetical protein